MQQQTLTQTITIKVGDAASGLANTGLNTNLFIGLSLLLVFLAAIVYLVTRRGILRSLKPHSFKGFRSLTAFLFLTASITSLSLNLPTASAAPTLTINNDQTTLNITVPEGGGTATTNTTLSTSTTNPTGYKLTAQLQAIEPGIDISLKGGDITTTTPLIPATNPTTNQPNANATLLTLKTTSTANDSDPNNQTDSTPIELTFTVDDTVTEGEKQLALIYQAEDNPYDPTPPAPQTMQSLTQDYCQNHMTIYNGTNEEAILNLTDPRGNTESEHQTYQVAKLADNNCWMLNNLKLGSTTTTTELTSENTNIAEGETFTLPQLVTTQTTNTTTSPGNNYDTPYTHGPVPGDTGEGATNYGYLYNWSAATAGETITTMPGDGTNNNIAPYSICPANWRLPTGGQTNDPNNEFSQLSAKMAGFTDNQDTTYQDNYRDYYANWQSASIFKGTFAGRWWGSFGGQGSGGYLWSSSAYPDWAGGAFYAVFGSGGVYPSSGNNRYFGFSVRCLLN